MTKLPFDSLELDDYEQTLADNFDTAVSLEGKTQKIALFEAAAKKFVKKNKDKRLNIRVYSEDLEKIKEMAKAEGLPYQTYITSLLHKISAGRLIFR